MEIIFRILDLIAYTLMIICGCCIDVEGKGFLVVLGVVFIAGTYLSIRILVDNKKQKRKEYWRNRKAIFDEIQRMRLEGIDI